MPTNPLKVGPSALIPDDELLEFDTIKGVLTGPLVRLKELLRRGGAFRDRFPGHAHRLTATASRVLIELASLSEAPRPAKAPDESAV
jgi:hypothetical protein